MLLLLLGCYVITLSIHAPTFAIAQESVGITLGWENADVFPQTIQYQDANYTLSFLYRDTEYEKIARQDASLYYAYNMSPPIYVNVGVANSLSSLHSWEVCLVTWQTAQGHYPLASVLGSKDLVLSEDVPIIARYFVFRDEEGMVYLENTTQFTLYWYEKATFNTGITVEQKYVRISLIILTQNSTGYQQFEDELLTVGQVIASYWKPLKGQSLISLGVPAQQLLLTALIAFVAFTKIAQYSNDWRKKSNNLKIFNNLASAEEKLMLQTILDLAKEKKMMETREIYAAIKGKAEKSMKFENLLSRLNHFEEYGFIRKDVVSVNNKPVLVWKT